MSSWDDDGGVFGEGDGSMVDVPDDAPHAEAWGAPLEYGPTQNNPLITREEDFRMMNPPVTDVRTPQGALAQPEGKVALVAIYDAKGQPLVARTVMKNGKPVELEEYRRPTPDEYSAILWGGKIVRGGVVGSQVPTTTDYNMRAEKTPLGMSVLAKPPKPRWMKIGGIALVGIALAGGGWWWYRRKKEQ